MSHMKFEQAIRYAHREACRRGFRYRVYKSRAVVGRWVTVQAETRVEP